MFDLLNLRKYYLIVDSPWWFPGWLDILLLGFLFLMFLFLVLLLVGLIVIFLWFVRISDLLFCSCIYLFFTWNFLFPIVSWISPLILLYTFCLYLLSAKLNEIKHVNLKITWNAVNVSINYKITSWMQQYGLWWFSLQASNVVACSCGFGIIVWTLGHSLLLGSFQVVCHSSLTVFSINFCTFFLIPYIKGQQAVYSLFLKEKLKKNRKKWLILQYACPRSVILSTLFNKNVIYSDIPTF